MSSSGIEIEEEITSAYNEMKMRSSDKFIIFKIEKKKKLIVDYRSGPKSTTTREEDKESFQELAAHLQDEPRYIVYRFGFTSSTDQRKIDKMAFIFWCLDWANIGQKMIYSSSKDSVKKCFAGLGLEFQVNDESELDYSTFADEMQRKS